MNFTSKNLKNLPSVGDLVTNQFGERLAWLITRRTRDAAKCVYVDLQSEDGTRRHSTVKVEELEPWSQPSDVVVVSAGQITGWLQRRSQAVVDELGAQLRKESPSGSDFGLYSILNDYRRPGRAKYKKYIDEWNAMECFVDDIASLRHPLHKKLLYRKTLESGLALVSPADGIPSKRYRVPPYCLHVIEWNSRVDIRRAA